MAVEALRQGVCKGDIENFTLQELKFPTFTGPERTAGTKFRMPGRGCLDEFGARA